MPLPGRVRKKSSSEMSAPEAPKAQPTDSGSTVPQGKIKKKGLTEKPVVRKKVPADDPETLDDSLPLGTDTLAFGTLSPTGAVGSIAGIGGISLTTIILVFLAIAVGFLFIRKGN